MSKQITASMLYDLIACPHRVTMDAYGDPDLLELSPNFGDGLNVPAATCG